MTQTDNHQAARRIYGLQLHVSRCKRLGGEAFDSNNNVRAPECSCGLNVVTIFNQHIISIKPVGRLWKAKILASRWSGLLRNDDVSKNERAQCGWQ